MVAEVVGAAAIGLLLAFLIHQLNSFTCFPRERDFDLIKCKFSHLWHSHYHFYKPPNAKEQASEPATQTQTRIRSFAGEVFRRDDCRFRIKPTHSLHRNDGGNKVQLACSQYLHLKS